MKMNILFNDKKGVINLTSHNVIIEDFKEHVCKRLKINPLEYKLKVDFLNNLIEPVLVSAKAEPIKQKSKTTYAVDELITGKNLQKIFIASNNKGAIYAYLYREHLISNHRDAIITKPMDGYILQDANLYNNTPFIEPSKYYEVHEKLYYGKQTNLEHLTRAVDDIIEYDKENNFDNKGAK